MKITDAEKLLSKSGIIKVDNYCIQYWDLDKISDLKEMNEEGGVCLEFNYTDDEGYDLYYEFTTDALEKAEIKGNAITLIDNEGAIVEIQCFELKPVSLIIKNNLQNEVLFEKEPHEQPKGANTKIIERSSGYWIADKYGAIAGPFTSLKRAKDGMAKIEKGEQAQVI